MYSYIMNRIHDNYNWGINSSSLDNDYERFKGRIDGSRSFFTQKNANNKF